MSITKTKYYVSICKSNTNLAHYDYTTIQHNYKHKNKNVIPKMRSQYHSSDRDDLAYYFIIFT